MRGRPARLGLTLMLLLALLAPVWAAQTMVLVVGDLNDSDATVLESKLREHLRTWRDQGRLEAVLASYNFAVGTHRPQLERLGLSREQAPLVAICEVDAQGLPTRVVWSQTITSAEQSALAVRRELGQAPDTAVGLGALRVTSLEVNPSNVFNLLNVKVRLRNEGGVAVDGPIEVRLSVRPQGQAWRPVDVKTIDRVPAGYVVSRDFMAPADYIEQPFLVRLEVGAPGQPAALQLEQAHDGAGKVESH